MGRTFLPTKNNLIRLQNTIRQHKSGQELLDKKALILKKKMENYKKIHDECIKQIEASLNDAEYTLKKAIVDVGFDELIDITNSIEDDDTISIKYLSLMGIEVPSIISEKSNLTLNYGLYHTTSDVDNSIIKFLKVKTAILKLTEIQNAIVRIKKAIEKVERRSNALKEVIVPRDEALARKILNSLEEAERDEFIRLKLMK